LLCGFLLSGCASVPPPSTTVDPSQVSAFELNGRVNVRTDRGAYPGSIRWQHGPSIDEVWLFSPVGSAVAHMRQDPSGALLVASDGKEYRAEDVHALARDVLGWDLPLNGLQYWVRGLPWPALDSTDEQRDESGRPKLLKQAGWRVAYIDWTPAGVAGLPSKLDVAGEGLRMRLVIDRWKVDAPR
jgi:outer membrane lipoprotein LolB